MMLALVGLTMAFLIAIALRGVREVERREAEARHAATHDELSGLPNRTALVAALDEATAARRADRTPVAVVYLDLDGFKEVNDAFGHETGDQLLQGGGARLPGSLERPPPGARRRRRVRRRGHAARVPSRSPAISVGG